MADEFELRLKDPAGNTVAIFDRWLEFSVRREVNKPAIYALRLDGEDARCALFEYDGQIEFWRRDRKNNIAWYIEAEAFCVNWRRYHDTEGRANFESSGLGYVDLLQRTIITGRAGTVDSHKSGAAETIIKDFVDDQAGPGAGARARPGLSIQADGGGGADLNIYKAYRNLLEACQEIAADGQGDFDVVGIGEALFEFRWYEGQRGTDRRSTVIFALERGNMSEPDLSLVRSQLLNWALVGGQGEGTARELVTRTDAAAMGTSVWGRRETFVDAREVSVGDTDALEDKGDAALAQAQATETFTFTVLQSPGCLYGRDYFLGDLVTARYNGVAYYKKVQAVEIVSTRDGTQITVETVDILGTDELRWLSSDFLSPGYLGSAYLESGHSNTLLVVINWLSSTYVGSGFFGGRWT